MLARWNGFQLVKSSHLLLSTHPQEGRLPLGQGLVAEPSAFASENYVVFARKCKENKERKHPSFVAEDASWYRALEARVNDNLDRWEENARQRNQVRLHSAKQGLQRLLDRVQAPLALAFGAVTSRLGPVADQTRSHLRSIFKPVNRLDKPASQNDILPQEGKRYPDERQCSESMRLIETDPEDLIILTKECGSLMLLKNVDPNHRLLALPVVTVKGKAKPPYRLRFARGGLVITLSIIMLGALPPIYRSLKFILEYPKTAEIVIITLAASIAYNVWSWATNTRTGQRELIAAAIQSRLIARDEAALSFLTNGAVDPFTEVLMECYVSRLLSARHLDEIDPLLVEIGMSAGIFELRKKPLLENEEALQGDTDTDPEEFAAVEWVKARVALLQWLAGRV